MVTQTSPSSARAAPPSPAGGLVLELERTAVPGQRLLFDACQKALKSPGIALTPILYSRFLLEGSLADGLKRLGAFCGHPDLDAGTLAEQAQSRMLEELAKPSVRLDPALSELLADAAKHGLAIGALSFLPAEAARALLERLGLQDRLVLHGAAKSDSDGIGPDCWLAAAKAMGVLATRCVALATGAAACRTALEAGMRTVVIPDEWTAHQDFGGADLVLDDLKALRVKDIQALLHGCAFR